MVGFAISKRIFFLKFFVFFFSLIYIYIYLYLFQLDDDEFESFIQSRGLNITDKVIIISTNYDNEAKPTVIRENIKFERKLFYLIKKSIMIKFL